MHEYGLMEDVVTQALETCRQRGDLEPVQVRVQVGEFAFASRESLETAFEILTRETILEGVTLELVNVSGQASCEGCGFEGSGADIGPEVSDPPAILLCPRCGSPLLVTAGAGVALSEVRLQDRGFPRSPTLDRGGF